MEKQILWRIQKIVIACLQQLNTDELISFKIKMNYLLCELIF